MNTILVVDDSPLQCKSLGKTLEKMGYRTLYCDNGADSIALARSELPDLVMMDVVMPGMNGFQATREISRDPLTGHIPVVLVSGKSQATDRQWGLRQGAKHYLVKPIAEPELKLVLNELLPNTGN